MSLDEVCGPLEGWVRLEPPPREQGALSRSTALGDPNALHDRLCARFAAVAAQVGGRLTHDPAEIALAFDKPDCKRTLAEIGVPTAPDLGPLGSADALLDGPPGRVFVKLNRGACAVGLVALARARGRTRAWTTVESKGAALFNTRRVRRLEDGPTLRALLDHLAGLGAHVERWVPKASVAGRAADLRVVTVAGRVSHTVARLSDTPFTNLHLGGARAPASTLRAQVTEEVWARMEADCEKVARRFGGCLSLGIDVAVTSDRRHHVVLEVNALGDLVHGATDAAGRTPQDAQLDAIDAGRIAC